MIQGTPSLSVIDTSTRPTDITAASICVSSFFVIVTLLPSIAFARISATLSNDFSQPYIALSRFFLFLFSIIIIFPGDPPLPGV
jgi:hypothetical protein